MFKKGYLPGWTEEVFIISSVIPGVVNTYRVKDMDDTPLEGSFYEQDLQKVTLPDDELYRIEKIVKRQGNNVFGVSFAPILAKKQPRKWGNRHANAMLIGELRQGGQIIFWYS